MKSSATLLPGVESSTNKPSTMLLTMLGLAVGLLLSSSALSGQCDSTWALGSSGNWNAAGNWNPYGVPNNNLISACIVDGSSTVTIDNTWIQVADFQLASGNVLNVNNGNYFEVFGSNLLNAGTINVIEPGGTNSYLYPTFSPTLSGGGTVNLSTSASGVGSAYLQLNGGQTLTNVDNTIQGDGIIYSGTGLLVNQSGGVINANSAGGSLQTYLKLQGSFTNAGLMEATNNGSLQIYNATINNAGGTISAIGSGASVLVQSGNIVGGTLNQTGGALFGTPTGYYGTLDGSTGAGAVTLNGTYTTDYGAQTFLYGSIVNKGTFQVNGGNGSAAYLQVASNVTLSGGGKVNLSTLTAGGGDSWLNLSGSSLTNANNTIQGEGIIATNGATLVNQAGGVINANSAGGTLLGSLTVASGTVNNTGLMEATNNGSLVLYSTKVNNGGGNITASGSGAAVESQYSTIVGGILNQSGGAFLGSRNGYSLNLDGSTGQGPVTLNGTATTDYNAATSLYGSIVNKGTLQVNGGNGSSSDLYIPANVTLSGGGTVNLSTLVTSGGNAYINLNGGTLTNADNTIRGSGIIYNSTSGTAFINGTAGTVWANSTGGTFQTSLVMQYGTVTNNGTFRVDRGNLLWLNQGAFTNYGSNTLTGGAYNIYGTTTNPGTLQIGSLGNSGGEIVNNAATILLDGLNSNFVDASSLDALSNFSNNTSAGSFTIQNGRNFTTVGNFTNNGTLTVGSGSKFTVNGNLTNFASNTLTGGTYSITGTLQFNGANIVANSANITMNGTTSKITDQLGNGALVNFAKNTVLGTFALTGGRNFTTKANFTNNGVLTVGSGSTFKVNGSLTNFAGTTLTGGTYNVTGTLQFNGANIVTNAATVKLTGANSKIVDQTGTTNGLANFATNAATGIFTIASGRNLSTAGAFSNAGTVKVSTGTTFTVAPGQSYTQTAGKTVDDGTMAVSGGGAFAINTGGIFGNNGTFSGNLTSGGTFNVGDTVNLAGKMAVTGNYVQSSTGTLKADIGGVALAKYDQLNVTGAVTLGGTLSLQLVNSFVPALGSSFTIMNFASETGNFATITGAHINANEHFAVVVNPTNVTLNVVAGPSPWDFGTAPSGSPSPTPEPTSLLLLGSGLTGLAAYRRKL